MKHPSEINLNAAAQLMMLTRYLAARVVSQVIRLV